MMNRTRKLFVMSVAAAAVLSLAGVGAARAIASGAAQRPAATAMTGMAPVSAQMVTPSFGWAITPDSMLITSDGGKTFSDARVPLPASYARNAAFVNASLGLAVAAVGNRITIARTFNGGRAWTVSQAVDPAMYPGAEYANLSIALGPRSTDAILAQVGTGQNFSVGTLFTSTDSGATWRSHPAPVAGSVSVDSHGTVWLAGGVFGNELYRSANLGASWTRSVVFVDPGQVLAAVSTPADGVLTATTLHNATTQVDTLTSSDGGRSWHAAGVVSIRGKTGMGVPVPAARTARGLLVLDTAGGRAYLAPHGKVLFGAVALGLPEGVTTATFAPGGTAGWALATYGQCLRFKSDCTLYHELVATTNAGASWHRIALWSVRLN